MSPLTIIGAGRVGHVFARCAEAAHQPARFVGRGEPIEAAGLLIVCTRADDLPAVIAATPLERRHDLVFVQNGLLRPFLVANHLADNTQGILYFAATARDGRAEPGAPSLFYGPHAGPLVTLLTAGGLPARALADSAELGREVAVKLAWNVIFGLLGQRFDEPVGASAARTPLLEALVQELTPPLAVAVGSTLDPQILLDRTRAYSMEIPAFRASVKEFSWRNGAVRAAARDAGLATPVHDALLAEVGVT